MLGDISLLKLKGVSLFDSDNWERRTFILESLMEWVVKVIWNDQGRH